jgi:hypothetical protein
MKGHLDPEVLAEYRAGLIAGRRGHAIDRHLAACVECSAVDGRLAEVSTLLAAAPVPAVPDVVARRLETALAAAAMENPIANERDSVPPPRHSHVSKAGWFGGFSSRALSPLAGALAVLVVLAGVAYGFSLLTGGSSSSSGPTSLGAAAPAAGSAQGSYGAGSVPSNGKEHATSLEPTGSRLMIVHSDVNYQPATVRELLEAEYGRLAAEPSASGLASAGQAGGAVFETPASAAVAGCVLRLTGGQLPVRAISARYRGAPATIVIIKRAGGGELALVAGSGCSATASDILARVVLR